MTRQQASTARRLLGWSFEQLAQKSGVPVSSVYVLIRLGTANSEHDHLMQAAFEQEGIKFSPSPINAMIDLGGKVEASQWSDDVDVSQINMIKSPPVLCDNPTVSAECLR